MGKGKDRHGLKMIKLMNDNYGKPLHKSALIVQVKIQSVGE